MLLMHTSPRAHFRLLTALLLALSMFAAACGGSDSDSTEAAESSTETEQAPTENTDESTDESSGEDYSDFKVVMILDGSAEDGGWNSTHLRSGRKVEANYPGIDFSFVEEIEPGQPATNAFQDAVDGGADLVIGTTFYQFDMIDVAADNPDVYFLTWSGFEPQPNVGHFSQASEDGRYMDGIVAGSLTEDRKSTR